MSESHNAPGVRTDSPYQIGNLPDHSTSLGTTYTNEASTPGAGNETQIPESGTYQYEAQIPESGTYQYEIQETQRSSQGPHVKAQGYSAGSNVLTTQGAFSEHQDVSDHSLNPANDSDIWDRLFHTAAGFQQSGGLEPRFRSINGPFHEEAADMNPAGSALGRQVPSQSGLPLENHHHQNRPPRSIAPPEAHAQTPLRHAPGLLLQGSMPPDPLLDPRYPNDSFLDALPDTYQSNSTTEYNQTNRGCQSGSTSKQVAPRSNNLFRVGPSFLPTAIHKPFFCANGDQMFPIMTSRIDRGFELGEAGNWIGYKRNYITLVSTFWFQNWTTDRFLRNTYFVIDEDNNSKVDIDYFAFAISVKCSDPDVKVGLVQHTPKRDKGPKYATPTYPAVPGGELPDHQTVKISSNKKNGGRVASMRKVFNFDRAAYYSEKGKTLKKGSILENYPCDLLTKVARFERIQFTKSLRVEPSNVPLKYFTLSVELLGIVGKSGPDSETPQSVVLATSDTVPLLVRGRSASKYPSEKTSGYRELTEKSAESE